MILNALNDLYYRLASDPNHEIAKPGYSPQNISFKVVLKPDGTLFAIQDARTINEKGIPKPTRRLCLGFEGDRSSGIKPYFLCDKSLYTLGYDTKEKNSKKLTAKFDAFREKILSAQSNIDDAQFKAVCRFLKSWSVERAKEFFGDGEHDKFLENGFGYFEIQGSIKSIDEQTKVKEWWNTQCSIDQDDIAYGQCSITGKKFTSIARLHPKIKGVYGGQAQQSLVSFNASSYESYGKDQSFNAPVSEKAAFQYGTALNSLLNGPKSAKHRIRIGDSSCVFWTDKPSAFEDIFGLLSSEGSNAPEQAQDDGLRLKLEATLKAIQLGRDPSNTLGEPDTEFFLLGIAPNAARLSVRFFYHSSIGEMLHNLQAHQHDIQIVREWETAKGKRLPDPEFPAYWQLLTQTARVSDEIPPLLGGSLMRSILENTRYPEALYTAVLRRIRADRDVNYLRAAIIKGTLTRNHSEKLKHPITIMLDTENTDPAYLLGRLFASLEKTQTDALGDLNAGLRDKFYSSASATPASVFPRILRTYQHHLAKLSGGLKVSRERLVQDILSGIPASGFPHNFNLQQQGIFAIGYYHQRKDFFTKKSED